MSLKASRWGRGTFTAKAVGTNAGATATRTISAGSSRLLVSGIQCSGDAAALVTIESPASTVLYSKRFAAAFAFSENFQTPKVGTEANNVLVKISASTANCEANIDGWEE